MKVTTDTRRRNGTHIVTEHPQIEAFQQAADLMRKERYWQRNPKEEVEFLRALTEVLTEVCYHLDSCRILDPAGLTAYRSVTGAPALPEMFGISAELVLVAALDNAISHRVAGGATARNTGDGKGAPV